MAFPSIRSQNVGSNATANTTSHPVTLPATIDAGDLIVVWQVWDGSATLTWDNTTHGTWTQITIGGAGSPQHDVQLWVKVADGTEDSGVLANTTNVNERSAYCCYAIRDWFGTIATGVSNGTKAVDTTTTPDPTTVTAAWGSADNLFLAFAGTDVDSTDGTRNLSTYPANYSLGQQAVNPQTSGSVNAASAARQLASDADDPGAFGGPSVADGWSAVAIVIRPAAAPTSVTTLPSGTPTSDDVGQSVVNPSTTGVSITAASGTNRMSVALLLREGTATPWSFTGCSWGNQAGTQVLVANNMNDSGSSTVHRIITAYRFMESQIAAKTGDVLTCTQSDGTSTIGLVWMQFNNVNQTTPFNSILKVEESEGYGTSPRSLALSNLANGFAWWTVLWGNATTATWALHSAPTELSDFQVESAFTCASAYSTSTGTLTAEPVPLNTDTLSQTMIGLTINPVGTSGSSVLPIFSYYYQYLQ